MLLGSAPGLGSPREDPGGSEAPRWLWDVKSFFRSGDSLQAFVLPKRRGWRSAGLVRRSCPWASLSVLSP